MRFSTFKYFLYFEPKNHKTNDQFWEPNNNEFSEKNNLSRQKFYFNKIFVLVFTVSVGNI